MPRGYQKREPSPKQLSLRVGLTGHMWGCLFREGSLSKIFLILRQKHSTHNNIHGCFSKIRDFKLVSFWFPLETILLKGTPYFEKQPKGSASDYSLASCFGRVLWWQAETLQRRHQGRGFDGTPTRAQISCKEQRWYPLLCPSNPTKRSSCKDVKTN